MLSVEMHILISCLMIFPVLIFTEEIGESLDLEEGQFSREEIEWILSFPVSKDILIIILSQKEGYHAAHAELLKKNIIEGAKDIEQDPPYFFLPHAKGEKIKGSWTFHPLIPILLSEYSDIKWHVFCMENTVLRLMKLLNALSSFNSSSDLWLGHVLQDREPTIIHHFADKKKKIKYPNLASGFAISRSLIKKLNERLLQEGLPKNDFSIDAVYEFSNFIHNNGKGIRLTHSPDFCVISNDDCATYPKFLHPCADPVPMDKIFVAVKTYNENHSTRVPILMKTWLKYTRNFALFSNEKDASLENVIVVPDTRKGHCAKTYGILQHSVKIMRVKQIDWLVIADDDTILSLSRLSRFLTCYNAQKPLAIGERYGFRVIEEMGYEYLTGGAGLALSAPLVERMLVTDACDCPMSTTPDDMFLFGVCLNRLDIRPVHSSLFHQARPNDYAAACLASQEPISFHKFWMIDPVQVYRHWFDESDRALLAHQLHSEL